MTTLLSISDQGTTLANSTDVESAKYQLVSASTSDEVCQAIGQWGDQLGVILLDWGIQGADAKEILQWLRSPAGPPSVEIVVVSQEFDREAIDSAIDNGAFYFLFPPYEPQQLLAIVRAANASCVLQRNLAQRIADTEDTFRLLDHGVFQIQTPRQAELLAVHLGSACDDPQRGVGLLELMLNGIEHGNLGITYDEKTTLIQQNRLRDEIAQRMQKPEFRDRRVTVKMRRLKRCLRISISDEGPGFDFEKFMVMSPDRMFDSHGRGVLLANGVLQLEYIAPGNRIEVTIPIEDGRVDPAPT